MWQSADPILEKYLPNDEAMSGLPGFGGVYGPKNLGLYSYGHLNPVIYTDPDGNVVKLFVTIAKVAIKGGDIYSTVSGIVDNAKIIANPNASIGEKLAAAADIALDVGTGINTKDIKAAAKIVEGAADKVRAVAKTEQKVSDTAKATRSASDRQARLRELADDPKVSSADRGWIKQEMNSIKRGQRDNIRVPPGKELAHERGREAAKGYGYKYSNLQDKDLHKTQHRFDDFGRANKERPPTNE